MEKYDPEYYIKDDELCINGVRFLSASIDSFSKEYLYLGYAKEYFQDEKYKKALLLTNGKNQIIFRDAEPEDILNDILSAFEFYSLSEQELTAKASQGKSLSDMMETMEKLYSGAILIFDINGRLLISVHEHAIEQEGLDKELENSNINTVQDSSKKGSNLNDENLYSEYTNKSSDKKSAPEKQMGLLTLGQAFYNKDGQLCHDISDRPERYFKSNSLLGTVISYLCIGQERVGYIMMFPESELEAMTALHLENIFVQNCIYAEEFTDTSSILMPKRTILENVLKENIPENIVCKQLAEAVRLDSGGYVLILKNHGIQNYTIYKTLEYELYHIAETVACEYLKYFVILSSAGGVDSVVNCLKEKMSYGNYSLGISMMLQDVTHIPTAFRQAEFAIISGGSPGIYKCEDFALNYLIQTLKTQEMSVKLLHPLIGTLEHYDNVNNTELLPTLCCYFKNNCHRAAAAKELNVHLNTLKYRLKRIEEIGNISLKESEDLFYLWLSTALYEEG